jgi:hypothetical protein
MIRVLLLAAIALLPSCGALAKRTPVMRTTTYGTAAPGAMAGTMGGPMTTTVEEKPFDPFAEGAAEAGLQMFSRPLAQ